MQLSEINAHAVKYSTLQNAMITDDKFQFAWPWIYKAGPLRFECDIASILDQKTIWSTAERWSGDLALFHNHFINIL